MFIALAAASAALPVPIQEPAALHPSSSTLVVQLPDVQAFLKGYKTTAPALLIGDPEVHTTIGNLVPGGSGEPMDPMALIMAEYDQGVETGEIPPFLDYLYGLKSASLSLDFAGGDVLAFVAGVESAEDSDLYAAQNFGFRLVADFVDEPTCEQVTAFLVEGIGGNGPRGMELSAKALTMPDGAEGFGSASIRVWSYVPSEPGNGANTTSFDATAHIIAGGTRVALVSGNVDLDGYVRALSTGAVESPAASIFGAGRAAFNSTPATPGIELFLRPFVEDLVKAEVPDALPALDILEALVGPAASLAIRGGHWRIGIEDGQFITQGHHQPSKGGPLSGVLGSKPLDPAALTLAHPNALVTSVTSLDADVLEKMIVMIANEEQPGALEEIEKAFDFNPAKDLAGALGNAASYSLPPLTSLLSAPNLMGAIQLNDQAAFTRGMDGLMRMAEGLGEDVQLVRDEYKGAMMYTLSFTGGMNLPMGDLPIDPASFIKPTITIMEDRVLMTTLSTHAKKEVRRVLKLSRAGKAPGIHEKITAMGDLDGATTVGYADWPTFLGALYSQIKNLAPLIAGGADLPFDPAMLPDAALLTRHFKPSENWTRMKDGMVLQYAKSSLGLEAAFMPMAGLAFAGMNATMRSREISATAYEEWDEADGDVIMIDMDESSVDASGLEVGRGAATEGTLMQVDVAITLYQLDHKGAAPASLADLLKKSDMYPSGYLDGDAVPMDGWGHALVYKKTANGYDLYSMGPNGADDSNSGDDISSN